MSSSPHSSPLVIARALVVAACSCVLCGTAMAQWIWTDGSGNKVFSDTAPPPGVPDKNILKKPGGRMEPQRAVEAPVAGPQPSTPAMPKVTGKDDQLEAKKKQAEKDAEEAAKAKRKAEEERYAKARADNCERAKRSKATIDSGMRLATTNAKGEREFLDDNARAQESKRVDEIIRSDCAPLPAPATAGPSATSR